MNADNIEFSESALESFQTLQQEAKKDKKKETIYKAILQKIKLIQENIHFGNPVAKRLVPQKYKEKDIATIFRVELPQYWRMLYTIRKNEKIEIIALILDIIDHNEYNKMFNYKKK